MADSVSSRVVVVLDTLPAADGRRSCYTTFGCRRRDRLHHRPVAGRARSSPSRGRRGIQGADPDADPGAGERLTRRRRATEAFITAARGGNLEGLIACLTPTWCCVRRDGGAVRRPADESAGAATSPAGPGRPRLAAGTGRVVWSTASRPDHGGTRALADIARLCLLPRQDRPGQHRRRPGPARSPSTWPTSLADSTDRRWQTRPQLIDCSTAGGDHTLEETSSRYRAKLLRRPAYHQASDEDLPRRFTVQRRGRVGTLAETRNSGYESVRAGCRCRRPPRGRRAVQPPLPDVAQHARADLHLADLLRPRVLAAAGHRAGPAPEASSWTGRPGSARRADRATTATGRAARGPAWLARGRRRGQDAGAA